MRRFICTAVLCFIALTPFSYAQNPFEPWLRQTKLSGVPFTDGTKVVPGAFYQIGAVGPYYGSPNSGRAERSANGIDAARRQSNHRDQESKELSCEYLFRFGQEQRRVGHRPN